MEASDEVEYVVTTDEMQELTMTSLGKLVFGDIYDRQNNSSSNSFSVDSVSFAYENMIHMPFDMIEKYGATISTLDISHNKFNISR